MRIGGFVKSSLVDYPGRVAAVVFTQGCNFRCPFCHNRELVVPAHYGPLLDEEAITSFLVKRHGVLQGLVVTGGEPTIQPDLAEFLQKIKALGYPVKLDTNGTRPDVLRKLLADRLVDYVAMDIKTALYHYPLAAGVDVSVDAIVQSLELIRTSGLAYEFRTTLVRPFCPPEDLVEISSLIKDAQRYRLQPFVPHPDIVDPKLLDQRQYTDAEYAELKEKWQRGGDT